MAWSDDVAVEDAVNINKWYWKFYASKKYIQNLSSFYFIYTFSAEKREEKKFLTKLEAN